MFSYTSIYFVCMCVCVSLLLINKWPINRKTLDSWVYLSNKPCKRATFESFKYPENSDTCCINSQSIQMSFFFRIRREAGVGREEPDCLALKSLFYIPVAVLHRRRQDVSLDWCHLGLVGFGLRRILSARRIRPIVQ